MLHARALQLDMPSLKHILATCIKDTMGTAHLCTQQCRWQLQMVMAQGKEARNQGLEEGEDISSSTSIVFKWKHLHTSTLKIHSLQAAQLA